MGQKTRELYEMLSEVHVPPSMEEGVRVMPVTSSKSWQEPDKYPLQTTLFCDHEIIRSESDMLTPVAVGISSSGPDPGGINRHVLIVSPCSSLTVTL